MKIRFILDRIFTTNLTFTYLQLWNLASVPLQVTESAATQFGPETVLGRPCQTYAAPLKMRFSLLKFSFANF